ncbi:MAG: hypothetical protein Fur007_15040 [Rhodoferax sp.]
MLVCGAAISTHLVAWAGKTPSTRQPASRRLSLETARNNGVTTGVLKIVRCIGQTLMDERI